jgi:hypothetical protein
MRDCQWCSSSELISKMYIFAWRISNASCARAHGGGRGGYHGAPPPPGYGM